MGAFHSVRCADRKKKLPQHHGTTSCQNAISCAMDRVINIYRPMLVHCVTLIPFRLFPKNLGNLQECFGQTVHRPPPGKKLPLPL